MLPFHLQLKGTKVAVHKDCGKKDDEAINLHAAGMGRLVLIGSP